MSITETKTPASKTKITRRQMLKSVSTATALAVTSPVFGAEVDEEKWATDPDTLGLVGLPLAAVHIERAIAAMAEPGLAGRWQVSIHSGDPDQYWGFRQIDAVERAYLRSDTYTGRSDDLSFVVKKPKGTKGGGFDYWNVDGTGDYGADCSLGRQLAEEYLEYIGKHPTNGNVSLLGAIVDSMMARRREPRTSYGRHTTGVELSFLTAVNAYAMATSKVFMESSAVEPVGKRNALAELRLELDQANLTRISMEQEAGRPRYEEALELCWAILDKIAAAPATSLADLKVKAYAIDWSARILDDEPYGNPSEGERQIFQQLVTGLLDEKLG